MHSCLIRKNTGKAEEFFSQCDNPVHTFSPLCVLTTLFSVLRFGFTSCVLWFNEARGDGTVTTYEGARIVFLAENYKSD